MKYLCFAILSGLCFAKPLHAQTLQSVTSNGNSTTSTIIINAGPIAPAGPQAGTMNGSLNLLTSPPGPTMSMGVVNTDNTSTIGDGCKRPMRITQVFTAG